MFALTKARILHPRIERASQECPRRRPFAGAVDLVVVEVYVVFLVVDFLVRLSDEHHEGLPCLFLPVHAESIEFNGTINATVQQQ